MSKIREKYYSGLTHFRPDSSGIRGKGVNKKSYAVAGSEYPYDRNRKAYGVPLAYDRGNAGNGGSRQNVNTPKNVKSDDERWTNNIDEMGHDGWVSGTPPEGNIVKNPPRSRSKFGIDDEDKNEALGVPFNSAKAGQGTGGSHTGGRVIPGTSGNWSGRPKGGSWDNIIDDEDLKKVGRQENAMPSSGPIKGRIRSTINPEENEIPKLKLHKKNPFSSNLSSTGKSSRHSPGFSFRESVRSVFIKEFCEKIKR